MQTARVIKVTAWTIILLQTVILWRTGLVAGGSLGSNLAQMCAAGLAVVSCVLAVRRTRDFARRFWSLMAASFLLWTVAQAGWIYSNNMLHQADAPFWVRALFFFYLAPMALALFLPADPVNADSRWTFYLDLAQLVIVVVTAYLYFVIPSLQLRGAPLNEQIRQWGEARNYIILGAFLIRLSLSHASKVRPFRQMATVLALYGGASTLFIHAGTMGGWIQPQFWFEFGRSVPFVFAAVFACSNAEVETLFSAPSRPWKTTLAFHILPLLTPLLVIALASRIVADQLLLAMLSISASVAVAIARVVVADWRREQATEALKDTETRYRLLFVSNPHPMWVLDIETLAFIDVNEAAVERYGWTREEFLTMTIRDIRAPEEVSMIEADRAKGLAQGFLSREINHRTKSGEIFTAHGTARTLTIGTRKAAIVMAEDISERKAAEDALRHSRQMLALHIQQTPLAFIEFDIDCHIVDWNPAAEKIFGYMKAEVIGRSAEILATEAFRPKVAEISKELLKSKGNSRGTNPNVRKDRKTIICDWYNTTIVDETGNVLGLASLVQDVTERSNLEERLRQSQKMEAIGTLAGGVAHDFNNLLTVIGGYASLVQDRVRQEQKAVDDLQEVIEASNRAAALTGQLLAFSRKQVTQTVLLDLNESVTRIERMLRRVIGENIKMETRLASDLHAIKADSGQIDQVIMNLAVNARDAMPNGGTLNFVTTNATPDHAHCPIGEMQGPLVLLSVTDTGAGMDADTLEHIYEPFFTTKKGKGTGLGLSTVFGIVKAAGGTINVVSAPGCGAAFHVFFPAANKAALLQQQRRRATGVGGGKETILLVEDERSVRELTSAILRSLGYSVITAANGADADTLSMELSRPLDLLITDVVMPGLSGPETTQLLRLRMPSLKVLYTSGYTDNELTRAALSSDPDCFLQKPFTPDLLARKVREILDGNLTRQASAGLAPL